MSENLDSTVLKTEQLYVDTPVDKTTVAHQARLPPSILQFGTLTLHRIRKLGAGGEAVVWLFGTHKAPITYAAVKCPKDPEGADLEHQYKIFERIQQTCGGIRGQIGNLDLVESENDERLLVAEQHVTVLPYVNGAPLHKVLRHTGPLEMAPGAYLCARISERMAELHSGGVVHRDLKPENVIILPPGFSPDALSVEVIDMALAHDAASGEEQKTGGTPLYLSPEQWDHMLHLRPDVGPDTDVYAFGHMAYAMFQGENLIEQGPADTAMSMREKHTRCIEGKYHQRLAALPTRLRMVLEDTLQPEGKRPTMQSMANRFRELCEELGVVTMPSMNTDVASTDVKNLPLHIARLLQPKKRSRKMMISMLPTVLMPLRGTGN